MAEPGWPLIPREILPAPVRSRSARSSRGAPGTQTSPHSPNGRPEAGRQLSIFGADTTEPSPADLAGLLAGPGRLGRMGGTARVSVRVDAAWRVHVLVAELVSRGLVVQWLPMEEGVRPEGSPPESGAPPHTGIDVPPADPPAEGIDPGVEPPDDPASPAIGGGAGGGGDGPGVAARGGDGPGGDVPGVAARDGAGRGVAGRGGAGRGGREPADRGELADGAVERVDDEGGAGAPPPGGDGDAVRDRPGPGVAGFEVRTAYSSRLNGLARAWPEAADQLFLSGPRLRLWVAAAGAPREGGYALGLDPDKSVEPVDSALRRVGLQGSVSEDGLHYLIEGRKSLARLAELVGDRPSAAPQELWPDGASA